MLEAEQPVLLVALGTTNPLAMDTVPKVTSADVKVDETIIEVHTLQKMRTHVSRRNTGHYLYSFSWVSRTHLLSGDGHDIVRGIHHLFLSSAIEYQCEGRGTFASVDILPSHIAHTQKPLLEGAKE